MRAPIISALLFIAFLSQAQKSPSKFGEIPIEDLKMTLYGKDSSAVAVVLFDFGKAYVSVTDISSKLIFERHVRIKILKKEGLSWADAGIQLLHRGTTEERVTSLKASTYNLEGGKVVETKMSKDGVFKEKFNRNIDLQKFTLPNVKEGSVIEYSYTVNSEFLSNFPNWQFQYTIPTQQSEYWAIIPDFFIMERYMQGYIPVSTYETNDKNQGWYTEKAHHWVVKDAPAFKEEPYMTNENDYVSKINFALAYINFPNQASQEIMGSWEKLAKELLENESFGGIVSGSGFLKKQVEGIVAGKNTALEKAEAIHTYVKSTLTWDGYKDYLADNLKEVFEKKKGTAGDINLALASLLEKAGFRVDMVLLSTRDHGFIRKQYPMSKQLNYVICRITIEDTFYYMDATEKFLPFNILPERCLNGEGLLVSKHNFGWVNLIPKAKDKSTISATLDLDAESKLNGTLSYLRNGYDAQNMRQQYEAKGKEDYLKSFLAGRTWEVENSLYENIDSVSKDVKEIYTISIEDHASVAGEVTYLNPFIAAQVHENPFKLQQREYPVDFGSPIEKIYIAKINIPEGFTVDELPKSKIMTLPANAARYVYNITQMGNTINLTSSFQINKALFTQEEYPNLREFYNQVVAKQADQIVIRKK